MAVGVNGGSLPVADIRIDRDGSRIETLRLRLDLTGQPTVPTGVYTGTLNIRAVVQ